MNTYVINKIIAMALFLGLILVSALSPSEALSQESTVISLNTGSSFKLMKIPYMSRYLARAIVKHREVSGPFKTPADLLEVSGMTAEILGQINASVNDLGDVVATFSEDTGSEGMAIPDY